MFALLHADHESAAREWTGIGNEHRIVQLFVLAPLDVAVSKLARFSVQDRDDILTLARCGLINAAELRARATEALADYVGNPRPLETSLSLIEQDIKSIP